MIVCNNLVLGYHKRLSLPFNLTVNNNQWLGIIGKNGCGKSTLLKTVLGNISALDGSIKVMDKLPGVNNEDIAYIPQERELNVSNKTSALTVVELNYHGWHFGMPLCSNMVRKKSLELLELVGAGSYMRQPFVTLSGGQKKRVYLAQALINQPKLLLLDEPLADLDPHAKQSFIQSLTRIRKHELTLLIISHDMHEIAGYLDGFIHFKDGIVHYCQELPCVRDSVYVGI